MFDKELVSEILSKVLTAALLPDIEGSVDWLRKPCMMFPGKKNSPS